jgi:uncharacterized protein
MKKQIREFQVFVKPVGALCNLDCQYCYYLKKSDLYKPGRISRMPEDLLERYIECHIAASTEDPVFFSWHGGEPTLAGIDFYKKAVSLQQKYISGGKKVLNGIQTNATMIDNDWCRFFADNEFYIGVSIDGPEKLHDSFRVTKDGKASFQDTLRGYLKLKQYNIRTEILTVINALNVNYPLEVYRFLKQLGSSYLTFLPLVERISGQEEGVSGISVPPDAFGDFLSVVFDEWAKEDIGNIQIQVIEEATRTAFNQEHTLCIFRKKCGGVPVVEHNGDFYSCDHYVDSDHLVGNIKDQTLAELLDSRVQKDFGEAKHTALPIYCARCEVLSMCNGECPKNRFIRTPDGEPGLNYLCSGYRRFFNHIKPFVDAVADEWKRNQ